MSLLYSNKKALNLIQQELNKTEFLTNKNLELWIIQSSPRSDMGKGTLVAQLLATFDDTIALKFDGLLNTNENGRHTAEGWDDFGIYEQFSKRVKYTKDHYILGGEIIRNFINLYGEYENLTFGEHFSQYFILILAKKWELIGKPNKLIIEIGGTLTDNEVMVYIPRVIKDLKNIFKNNISLILLTELGFNGDYIKTRGIQDAVSKYVSFGLHPDIILFRLPKDIPVPNGLNDYFEFERTVIQKLYEGLGIKFNKIAAVPYFENKDLSQYTDYVKKYIKPFLLKESDTGKIFIGSRNSNKIRDYTNYLDKYVKVKSVESDGYKNLKLDVPEGLHTIEENSFAKARAYARATEITSIAEDTGFFIDCLGGLPGVSIKRWGGELKQEVNGKEFIDILKNKLEPYEKNQTCYFKTVFTICKTDGSFIQFDYISKGYIDSLKLESANPTETESYPLGLVFKTFGREKVWNDMSDAEKAESDKEIIEIIKNKIGEIFD